MLDRILETRDDVSLVLIRFLGHFAAIGIPWPEGGAGSIDTRLHHQPHD